ncbi:MAG: outer membrane protein assembly factor BamA [Alphaproteobacteria bacterium]|nr:MAG: outer membrane protein assembly factor BamA [Alphaproteobacteria bacterium]
MVPVRKFLGVAVMAALLAGFPMSVGPLGEVALVSQAQAAVVNRIEVRGNARMDAQTVISYLTITPGQSFSNKDIDDSVKALFATGLFTDVAIYQSGGTLVVEVDESGIINQVFFEGNKRLKDEVLASVVQSAPRSTYSEEKVSSDVDRILEAYARVGRKDAGVTYEIVPLANKRVNVVFRISEGDKTKIKQIVFVGNNAFGTARLRDIIETKQSHIFSWLNNDDIYDPDRLQSDEERLRRFYYNNGYADFQIISSDVSYDAVANQYVIAFTIDEGVRYRFGNVAIDNTIAEIDAEALYPLLKTVGGKHYSAKDVEDTVIALTESIAARGYAFVRVTPRGNRNFDTATIDVVYEIDQGPRVYIQEIAIIGNDRTRDHVIRREFDISEGDALNQVMVQKAKRRLEALGFFEQVDISTRPGDAPDRVVLVVRVIDKATGEFAIGGGYSTASGPLGEISFSERNFLGRGQFVKIAAGFGDLDGDNRTYTFSFTEPYFLGYRISAGYDIVSARSDANSNRGYGLDSLGATLRLGMPLTDKLQQQVFYTFVSEDTDIASSRIDTGAGDGIQGNAPGELSAALAPPVSPTSWIKSGFGYTLTYTDLDNVRDPREGIYLTLRQDFYGAGGDAEYLRTEGSAVAFLPLSEYADIVGMLRARAGANTLYGGTAAYRAQDNFFQGSRQIRGFENYGFGPRDPVTGDALGGLYYWNATGEITFPMPYIPESIGIRGAFFVDAGQLWGLDSASRAAVLTNNPGVSAQRLDDNTLRASVGASLIWASPFGPLRIDYAIPISEAPWDRNREFNFGISTNF